MKNNVTPQPINKEVKPAAPMRQIIIETDGNGIHLKKAEVNGSIELIGILSHVINHFSQSPTPTKTKK